MDSLLSLLSSSCGFERGKEVRRGTGEGAGREEGRYGGEGEGAQDTERVVDSAKDLCNKKEDNSAKRQGEQRDE